MKTAVLGAGSWGTALASVLSRNGHETLLFARRRSIADEVNTRHSNQKYLPDAALPETLRATDNMEEAVRGADFVLFVVPSASMVQVIRDCHPFLSPDAVVAHAVKGFEAESKRRMSEILLAELPAMMDKISVISGPSHAEEVVSLMPTTIVVSGHCREAAEFAQDALMNQYLRVYTNPDVVGTELGGCLKNIIALGVGIADGLGYGDNAKAALMTRGLAEIARLGLKLGASPLTFAGLSGVGDLIVTCTSRHSRNFRAGHLLGRGATLVQALDNIGMVVEGVTTTRATVKIASDLNVDMPITTAIYEVLYENKRPEVAVADLMGRERAHELEDIAKEALWPEWAIHEN